MEFVSKHNEYDCIDFIVCNINKDFDINHLNSYKQNILHYASYKGYFKLFKFLISIYKDININQQDANGDTYFINFCKSGNVEAVQFFLDELDVDINISNRYGKNALILSKNICIFEKILFNINYKFIEPNSNNNYYNEYREIQLHYHQQPMEICEKKLKILSSIYPFSEINLL